MKYKLEKPIEVGDLNHRIVVDELEVVSISMNFHALVAKHGNGLALLSVVMRHVESGWTHTVTYEDEHVGEFWHSIDGVSCVLQKSALAKLIEDGKLPPGRIITEEPTSMPQ